MEVPYHPSPTQHQAFLDLHHRAAAALKSPHIGAGKEPVGTPKASASHHISSCFPCHRATCENHQDGLHRPFRGLPSSIRQLCENGRRRNGLCNSSICYWGKSSLQPSSCCHRHSWSIPASRGRSRTASARHLRSTPVASGRCSSPRSAAPLPTESLLSPVVDGRGAGHRTGQRTGGTDATPNRNGRVGPVPPGPCPWMKLCSWQKTTCSSLSLLPVMGVTESTKGPK